MATQLSASVPLFPQFDRSSDEFQSDPHKMMSAAHAAAPVFYDPKLEAWMITKYDDVMEALKDVATYSSADTRGIIPPPADILPRVPDMSTARILMGMDPPEHTAIRMPMQRALSKRLVDAMEPLARKVANELIDSFIDRGSCDLITEFCYPFSAAVIVGLLGVPVERAGDYRRWLERRSKLALSKPNGTTGSGGNNGLSEEEIRARWEDVAQANEFYRGYVLDHIDNPKDDMIQAMLEMKDADGKPSFEIGEIVRSIQTLVGGGHDTTANFIANMAILFSRNPDQLDALKADPSLLNNAVEEGLRCLGPALLLARTARREIGLRDAVIPEGAQIFLVLHGANYDEEKFENAGKFDIRRANANKQLNLGFGRHACVGQPLARLEAQVAIQELYRRMPDLRVDFTKPITYANNNVSAQKLTTMTVNW